MASKETFDKSEQDSELDSQLDYVKKLEETDERPSRDISSIWLQILRVLAIGIVIFHVYTAFTGSIVMQNTVHFGIALSTAFVIYPMKKSEKIGKLGIPLIDTIFILIVIIINIYFVMNFDRIFYELGYLRPDVWDIILGSIFVLLVLEAARRAIGIVFPLLSVIAAIYAIMGPYFPSIFQHSGYTWNEFATKMFIGQLGILQGNLLGVSSGVVAIFIIFGALLLKTGGGSMFIELALAIAGGMKGGPAKVATVASGLFGSVTGSTAANTATTGVFTIPLMKNNGYKPHFAAGVESAASCGGQILPPIMGAAAFVLAEVTAVDYAIVAATALIPAILYFSSVFVAVHLEAQRLGLKPIDSDKLPKLKELILTSNFLTLFVPVVILVVFLAMGYTPPYCAFMAVSSSLILYIATSIYKKEFMVAVRKLLIACVEALKTITLIAVILATAQIIATVIGMTGLGLKLAALIAMVGEASLFITLVLGMIVTILMGMGVPTIAAYMLAAAVIAQAFVGNLGLPVLASHLFILYYAIMSGVTPPVALAAYVASGIANTNWFTTAITASKIGLAGFLIPFMFIYNPALLGQGTLVEVSVAIITAMLGIVALAGASIGYFFSDVIIPLRVGFLASALLLITAGLLSNVIGVIILVFVLAIQYFRAQKLQPETISTS